MLFGRGLGVPHIAEMNVLWGPRITHGLGWKSNLDINKPIIPAIQAY
jgi:hypothetical protein